MSKSLPNQANLDHLKNEAKALHKAYKHGDASVCSTLRCLTHLKEASDKDILAADLSLQKVQHALAIEYGFENWKTLKDHVTDSDLFAMRVQEAFELFTSKGPDHDSTGSPHELRQRKMLGKLLKAGDEGSEVMRKLARSENGRARYAAALFFGISGDPRAPDELLVLLDDPAAKVRRRAVRFYASQIHPARSPEKLPWPWETANTIPNGVEAIFPLTRDDNIKIRVEAITALSAYAQLGDERIVQTLTLALDDKSHKVQHAAARALGVKCHGCGNVPKAFSERSD